MADQREEELSAFARELYARKPEKVKWTRPKPERAARSGRGFLWPISLVTAVLGLVRVVLVFVHHG